MNRGKLNLGRFISSIIILSMACSIMLGGVFSKEIFAAENNFVELNRDIEILEIRGYTEGNNLHSELSDVPNALKGVKNAKVTTVSMKRFVALREELSGKYDVIYIGSGAYSTSGVRGKDHNTRNIMNDITHLKANEIKNEFIKKGQIVILHKDIFKQEVSKLKNYFGEYRNNTTDNVIVVDNANQVSEKLNQDFVKSVINKRPFIKKADFNYSHSTLPGEHGGIENTIKVEYRLSENTDFKSGTLFAKIYLDANNNKQYESEELLISKQVNSAQGTLTYTLPPAYSGLRFLKFEIIDEKRDLKDYREETTILKGAQVKINVLQVTKAKNDISNLNNFLKNKLGGSNSDYHINIDVTDMGTFKGPKYSELNGKYDMLIFGFADSYNNSDIGIETAKRVEDFIKTGQSVMFTHDTMFGQGNTWVNKFAEYTGQIKPFHDLGNGAPYTSNDTKGVNGGLIVNYPFKLEDSIRVATTHSQYYTLDLEDPSVIPWYNIVNGGRDEDDSWNHYYTYSKGTVTYSGTGHTNNQYHNFEKEMNLFVNTMYTAFFGANHAPTITVVNPNKDKITLRHTDSIPLKYIVNDLDLKDDTLNTKVYFDVKGILGEVLNRNVARGSIIEQSFDNPMPLGGKFNIVIEATDKLGARAKKIIEVTVESPQPSNLQVNRKFSPDKIALGEKTKIEYAITFPELINQPDKSIENIQLVNKIPKGLEISKIGLPQGWSYSGDAVNGYTLNASISDVSYRKTARGYVADPILFSIEVEPTDNGEYKLESGYIEFNDLDGQDKTVFFNDAILKVETRVKKLILDKKALVIKKGASDTLTVTVLPENASNKAVRWESSNSDIASVAQITGTNIWEVTIIGNKVGQAIIKVISLDNEEITDTCTVNVIHPVEGISINPSEAELRVAQTLELQAIFDPPDAVNKNVTWVSSDSDIVSIEVTEEEKVVVLAREQGIAVITVTTEEGGLQAYSTITVKPLIDPPVVNPTVTNPRLAGYGYVHPLSLAHMNMIMEVESQIKNAQLRMTIPDIGLLFGSTSELTVKLNGNKLHSSTYDVTTNNVMGDTITIDLGDLTGADKHPTTYTIAVYTKINPSSKLVDINNYNDRVKNKEVLTVANSLKAKINVGGSVKEFDFQLEEYKLELIKIPSIN